MCFTFEQKITRLINNNANFNLMSNNESFVHNAFVEIPHEAKLLYGLGPNSTPER